MIHLRNSVHPSIIRILIPIKLVQLLLLDVQILLLALNSLIHTLLEKWVIQLVARLDALLDSLLQLRDLGLEQLAPLLLGGSHFVDV